MPELPEVETVRRSVAEVVVGQRVTSVRVHRPDVVRGEAGLLRLGRVESVQRLGKQLALVGDSGRCVCIHLGMTGSLCTGEPSGEAKTDHVHIVWRLTGGRTLRFRDPRRFGGVWAYPDVQALWEARWSLLGPDATVVRPGQLRTALGATRRAVKAALLDQRLVAGLGNIYVDEALHRVGIHPLRPADTLGHDEVARLIRATRQILQRAILAGGSTLRDYVDANGSAGGFQHQHRVYGRGGQPCHRCGQALDTMVVAGRTTVACPHCQQLILGNRRMTRDACS